MSKRVPLNKLYAYDKDGNRIDVVAVKGADGKNADVTAENIASALGYTPADTAEVDSLGDDVTELKDSLVGLEKEYAEQIKLLKAVRDALKGGDVPGAIGLLDTYLLDKEVLA